MNEKYLYGIIGLLAGIVLAFGIGYATVNREHARIMGAMSGKDMQSMMTMMDGNANPREHDAHHADEAMSNTMQGMTMGLEDKTGDEFDKAFITGMIVHHQGAIDMANAALKNAKHQEIRNMANDIISAQTKEINQMKEWQAAWYK